MRFSILAAVLALSVAVALPPATDAIAADPAQRVGSSVLGGTNFRLTASAGAPAMTWTTGNSQSAYQIPSIGGFFQSVEILPPPIGSQLPAGATSYTDTRVLSALNYCYVLTVFGGNPASIVGNSDVLCTLPGSGINRAQAGSVTIGLNQTTQTTLNWTAPSGTAPTAYVVVSQNPFTGQVLPTVLPSSQTTFVHNTNNDPHCYLVVAFGGSASPSAPDVTCAFPSLSKFVPVPDAGGRTMTQTLQDVAQGMSGKK
jgi:hypothetical protein